jgi:sugar diacid utilization regulator
MLRGAREADLLSSCRQSMRVMWDELSALAGDTPAGRAIVADLSRPLIDYVEVFSEVAAETYAEVQAAMSSSRRQSSRRLVEDLLAGRELEAGAPTDATRRSELDDHSSLVVVTAALSTPLDDEAALMLAAATLARSAAEAIEPAYAVLGEEIVIVRAQSDEPRAYVDALEQARIRLHRDGIRLAVGVSAVHHGLAAVPRAYQDAWIAREQLGPDGGLVALATMTPLDYLLLRAGDGTAWRLVPDPIRRFIEDDLGQAGLLIQTLMAYVESDLNAKLAAERLYVHPNTAHYRLGKISEITGCDLRSQTDIMALVLAVRLAQRR